MDQGKKTGLRKYYKEVPEQQLLDMLLEDEKSYEDGAYALLVEEAKRRSLEDKLNEIKIRKEEIAAEKEKIEKERHPEYRFLRVYTTPSIGEIAVIKSLLDGQKIPYYIKGENFGTLYGPADGLTSVDVMVREDFAEDARELLKDFIKP
jgi:hypothetical protein